MKGDADGFDRLMSLTCSVIRTIDPSSPDAGQLQSILRLVSGVFGSDVLGAYLHGSAVLGGLRPTSDLDVLVVLDRPTTATQRRTSSRDFSRCRAHELTTGPRGRSS